MKETSLDLHPKVELLELPESFGNCRYNREAREGRVFDRYYKTSWVPGLLIYRRFFPGLIRPDAKDIFLNSMLRPDSSISYASHYSSCRQLCAHCEISVRSV